MYIHSHGLQDSTECSCLPKGGGGGMGSHGAVGKGGGGKEKGKPGIADPGAAAAAAAVSAVDEVGWLVPDETNTHFRYMWRCPRL